MKSKLYLLMLLVLTISCYSVLGATCNSTSALVINSTSYTDKCTVDSPGIYWMDGTNFNGNGSVSGALRITVNNTWLNCNGSTIYGNWTGGVNDNNGYFGIYINNGLRNISVYNCKVRNLARSILLSNVTGNIYNNTFNASYIGAHVGNIGFHSGSNFTGNTLINNSYAGYYITNNLQTSRGNIRNNIFYSWYDAIREDNGVSSASSMMFIENNTFNMYTIRPAIGSSPNSTLWEIYNNTLNGNGTVYEEGFAIRGSNHTISYNTLSRTQYNVYCQYCNNVTVSFNTFKNGDIGSSVRQSNWFYFLNNTIQNMTSDIDSYNIGFLVFNTTNTYIQGNNFTEVATAAIVSQGSNYTTITDNTIDFLSLLERDRYLSHDGAEFRCAMLLMKRYKGYFNQYGNYQVIIARNTFDGDTPCYLHAENITNLVQDFPPFWYVKYQTSMPWQNSPFEAYIPNYYNNMSWYHEGTNTIRYNYMISDGNRDQQKYVETNISKTVQTFRNINNTDDFTITRFGLLNARIILPDGTYEYSTGTYSKLLPQGSGAIWIYDNWGKEPLSSSSPLAGTILKILIGIIALIVLIVVLIGILIHLKDNVNEISPKEWIQYAITFLVILILSIALMEYVASLL